MRKRPACSNLAVLARPFIPLFIAAALAGCGGGGGGSSSSSSTSSTGSGSSGTSTTITGPVALSTNYPSLAAQCAAPRAAGAIDPVTGKPYGDRQGSLTNENDWIRDYVYDTYLWYPDVPATDPTPYVIGATVPYVNPSNNVAGTETVTTDHEVVDAYFNSQRSPLTTSSGRPKDQFHFTYVTSDYVALEDTGAIPSYGFTLDVIDASPPRQVVVAYVDPNTPAAAAGIVRGEQIYSVDGINVVSDGGAADTAAINAALFSPASGATHTIQVSQGASLYTSSLTAETLPEQPVQLVGTLPAPYASVGYMLFNEHIATAESALINAVNTLNTANNGAGVTDLVLDIRYNGGGLLDIASELASMISSSAASTGQTFEKETFNDRNPFGLTAAQSTTPFWQVAQGYSATEGVALPHLNLSRVFVITTSETCSASEAIMNGLRGIGVEVIQIGSTTCGKPYGFFPQDNCSTTYFAIQFQGVNALGFGDYADGFTPTMTPTAGNLVTGCEVADDFAHPLGSTSEANLATALSYLTNGTCPSPALTKMPRAGESSRSARVIRPAPLENRILHLERLQARQP
jgi:hypothetical protein